MLGFAEHDAVRPAARPRRRKRTFDTILLAGHAWADASGHAGGPGGWIRNADGRAICRGWYLYALKLLRAGYIVRSGAGYEIPLYPGEIG